MLQNSAIRAKLVRFYLANKCLVALALQYQSLQIYLLRELLRGSFNQI